MRDAARLSPADAAAVFEALTGRVEQSDDLRNDEIALSAICDWCGARKELLSQLVSLLGRLPTAQLPLRIPLKLVEVVQGTDALPIARQLLERWGADRSSTGFATAATAAANRLKD